MTDIGTDRKTNIERSNYLPDLAARINEGHEAVVAFVRGGLERAIDTGNDLIEAKCLVNMHGKWLPWLQANCPSLPVRTAQHYMRLAKHQDEIRSVAHLTVNEASALIADPNRQLLHMRVLDHRAQVAATSFEAPSILLPAPDGKRKVLAVRKENRTWALSIGPDITNAELKEREALVSQDPKIQALLQQAADLEQKVQDLKALAEKTERAAYDARREARRAIVKAVGAVRPYTKTYWFEADEYADAALIALNDNDAVVERLYEAVNNKDLGLRMHNGNGTFGDMTIFPDYLTEEDR
jgi:hypothetical protein